MHTQKMIAAIVVTILLAAIAVAVGLVVWLGWMAGLVVSVAAMALLIAGYLWLIKPWHLRWGATDAEVDRQMPGDDLIPDAGRATHAITIDADAEVIWPWLVQLGFGRAGWYSYDWIDNDFRPSADRILPEHQSLAVGDQILMAPGMGLSVVSVDPPRSIVSRMDDGSSSWCLALYPEAGGGTRLVSRWRPKLEVPLVALAFIEPGAFIMEQKMLRTIRDRVERSVAA